MKQESKRCYVFPGGNEAQKNLRPILKEIGMAAPTTRKFAMGEYDEQAEVVTPHMAQSCCEVVQFGTITDTRCTFCISDTTIVVSIIGKRKNVRLISEYLGETSLVNANAKNFVTFGIWRFKKTA